MVVTDTARSQAAIYAQLRETVEKLRMLGCHQEADRLAAELDELNRAGYFKAGFVGCSLRESDALRLGDEIAHGTGLSAASVLMAGVESLNRRRMIRDDILGEVRVIGGQVVTTQVEIGLDDPQCELEPHIEMAYRPESQLGEVGDEITLHAELRARVNGRAIYAVAAGEVDYDRPRLTNREAGVSAA